MPEKPEVMTVVKNLIPRIVGKRITGCNVYWDNIIASPTTDEFKKKIIGEKINDIVTRGKFIVVGLDHYSLLIHLRMEGKFFFRKKGDSIAKHEHVEFILDDDISFRYHDVRKFGKMYLLNKEDTYLVKPLSELGLEFYDDEILFMSGISPMRRGCDVSVSECQKIIDNTKEVLSHAVKLGGTTIKSFTSSEGVHGLFQNELLVHGKGGSPCPKCGRILEKTKIGGRGTHYCTNCQK